MDRRSAAVAAEVGLGGQQWRGSGGLWMGCPGVCRACCVVCVHAGWQHLAVQPYMSSSRFVHMPHMKQCRSVFCRVPRPNFGTERAQQVGAPPRRDLTKMGRHLRAPPRRGCPLACPVPQAFLLNPTPKPFLDPQRCWPRPWGHAQDVRVRRAPAEGPKLPGTLVRGVPGQPARRKPGQAGSPPRHWQAILTR